MRGALGSFNQQRLGERERGDSFKLAQILDVTASGPGTFVAAFSGVALIYAFGPGGSGAMQTGGGPPGADGGAALYKRIPIVAGQKIPFDVGVPGVGVYDGGSGGGVNGNSGTDTKVTLPSGIVLTASAGKGGSLGGTGGVASGGDVNRTGGAHGGGVGEDGGNAGPTGSGGAGGGAAGLASVTTGLTYPGNGSAGSSSGPSAAGGSGRVLIMLIRKV